MGGRSFLSKQALLAMQFPGQSEKFQTMCKTEMCRNWENGYCQYGSKVRTYFCSLRKMFLLRGVRSESVGKDQKFE
jgi:hypothetical protein